MMEKISFNRFQNSVGSRLTPTSEVEISAKLSHMSILPMMEWFQTHNHICLITEWMRGGDLLQALLEGICFTVEDKRRLFSEMCDGVKYLHHQGFTHRDLKPENCFLNSKDPGTTHLNIADLGLTIKNEALGDCRTFCGTLLYMAPDIFKFRQRNQLSLSGYGREADMWSLGVTLYILMSGEPPFEINPSLEKQILAGQYKLDGQVWTSVSKACRDLVDGLMLVDHRARLTAVQASNNPWVRAVEKHAYMQASFPFLSDSLFRDLLLTIGEATSVYNLSLVSSSVRSAFAKETWKDTLQALVQHCTRRCLK